MVFETFIPNLKMTGALSDWSTRFSRTGEAVHLMTLAGAPELSGTGLDAVLYLTLHLTLHLSLTGGAPRLELFPATGAPPLLAWHLACL